MSKKKDHEHDFLSVLHCKECGEQFHVNWMDAIKQAKLDAVAEVLQRTKSTITIKAAIEEKKIALKVVQDALDEVKKIYEEATDEDHKEATDMALEAIESSDGDFKGTIS